MASARVERVKLRRRVDDGVLLLFALVSEGIGWATTALLDQDVERAEQVIADDEEIDERCEALIALVKEGLPTAVADPAELEFLIGVLQIVPELERSADLVEHIAQRATRGLGGRLTPQARGVIQSMGDAAIRMWHESSTAYRQRSRDAGFNLQEADDELDGLAGRLVSYGATEGTDAQVAAELALVARFYERIGDHAVNLARRMETLAAPRRLAGRWPTRSGVALPTEKRGRVAKILHSVSRLRLAPTDEGFFDLFEASATNLRDCAEHVSKLIASEGDLDESFDAVKACERRGDELSRDVLTRLDASFVTPYDREDIHQLVEELDDVVDDMFAAASLIQLVGVDPQPAELSELAEVLVSMAHETVALIACLRSRSGARLRLERIEHLERQGDLIFRRAMGHLLNGDHDAIYVIKWKDVIEALEKALNAIEDLSDVVESALVKNG
jgi:predicted phosphate transport protein (TIGR00153 family)